MRRDSRHRPDYLVVLNVDGRYISRRHTLVRDQDQIVNPVRLSYFDAEIAARKANAEKTEKTESAPVVDIEVQNEGTIFLFRPVSARGQQWINEHIPDEAQFWGKAVVVEHRYIAALVQGARGDGLVIE